MGSQQRFACPRCGVGRLAPGKCRADDVRRYCLPCSQATGRLVRRVVPAREGARARKVRAARERADAVREREATALLSAARARAETPPAQLASTPTKLERKLAGEIARALRWWPWLNDLQRAGVGARLVEHASSVLGAGVLEALATVPRRPRQAPVATFALAPIGRALRSGRARPAAVRRAVLEDIGEHIDVGAAIRSVAP